METIEMLRLFEAQAEAARDINGILATFVDAVSLRPCR